MQALTPPMVLDRLSVARWGRDRRVLRAATRLHHQAFGSRLAKRPGFDIVIEDASARAVDWPENFHVGCELASVDAVRDARRRFAAGGVAMKTDVFHRPRVARFFCEAPGGLLFEIDTRSDADAAYRATFDSQEAARAVFAPASRAGLPIPPSPGRRRGRASSHRSGAFRALPRGGRRIAACRIAACRIASHRIASIAAPAPGAADDPRTTRDGRRSRLTSERGDASGMPPCSAETSGAARGRRQREATPAIRSATASATLMPSTAADRMPPA